MAAPRETDPDVSGLSQEILNGEQTRLAIANFRISSLRFPQALVQVLGLIKSCAAHANSDLKLLSPLRVARPRKQTVET